MSESNILIYRSTEENIRNNSKFTLTLVEELKDSMNIDLITDNNKNVSLGKFNNADLIIIFAHGDLDCIYHTFNESISDDLINNANINITRGKKIIAFCCFTGTELAESAINSGCITYVGFTKRIFRELKDDRDNVDFLNETGNTTYNFISNIYSDVFYETLRIALEKNWHFKKFEEYLSYNLLEKSREALKINDLRWHLQFLDTLSTTANSIKLSGDPTVHLI